MSNWDAPDKPKIGTRCELKSAATMSALAGE